MGEEGREYVIPLGAVKLSPKYKRAPKTIRVIRGFLSRHLNVDLEKVKLDPKLNERIWVDGLRFRLSRIKVKISIDEEGNVKVMPSDG